MGDLTINTAKLSAGREHYAPSPVMTDSTKRTHPNPLGGGSSFCPSVSTIHQPTRFPQLVIQRVTSIAASEAVGMGR